jgi:hypothetical protein
MPKLIKHDGEFSEDYAHKYSEKMPDPSARFGFMF